MGEVGLRVAILIGEVGEWGKETRKRFQTERQKELPFKERAPAHDSWNAAAGTPGFPITAWRRTTDF